MTKMLLASAGHDVMTSGDGPSGIRAVQEHAPEIGLLDIGLPRMNGYEVARAIRQLPQGRAMRLIAVTGFGQPEDRRRALEAGFDAHLVKPIEVEELSALLGRLEQQRPAEAAGRAAE